MPANPAQFLGNTVGEAAAFAAGLAVSPALRPVIQSLSNEAEHLDPTKPLDPALVAEAVAHGHISEADGEAEAQLSGISHKRFAELVKASREGPGTASAFALWRRGQISDGEFRGALTRAGIEPNWITELMKLKTDRLSPPVVALAIVRGLMDAPFPLPFTPPAGVGKVPAFPKSTLDAKDEAAAFGFDEQRLFVQTAISGRPMGPEAAAGAFFRSILEHDDYLRAILEGDVRGEWADAILEHARQIPSTSNFVQHHLRGWVDAASMYAGAARHGMAKADTDVLFEIAGRPLSWHQVFIGIRRGGVYNGPITDIHPAFLKALRESDIRPEWYNLAWAQRFAYPTAFVLRSLTEAHDISQARAEEILLFEGWEPALAKQVSEKWAAKTAAVTADPYIGKADNQLWTALHKAYVKTGAVRTDVEPILTRLVANTADRNEIFSDWDDERKTQSFVPPPA